MLPLHGKTAGAPGVVAPREVVDPGKASPFQDLHRLRAAHPFLAVDHVRTGPVEGRDPLPEVRGVHVDVDRVLEVPLAELGRCPDIEDLVALPRSRAGTPRTTPPCTALLLSWSCLFRTALSGCRGLNANAPQSLPPAVLLPFVRNAIRHSGAYGASDVHGSGRFQHDRAERERPLRRRPVREGRGAPLGRSGLLPLRIRTDGDRGRAPRALRRGRPRARRSSGSSSPGGSTPSGTTARPSSPTSAMRPGASDSTSARTTSGTRPSPGSSARSTAVTSSASRAGPSGPRSASSLSGSTTSSCSARP